MEVSTVTFCLVRTSIYFVPTCGSPWEGCAGSVISTKNGIFRDIIRLARWGRVALENLFREDSKI